MSKKSLTRRDFVGNMAASAAAFTIVPRKVLGGPGFKAPSDTVNVASVGAGGMAASNMNKLTTENIVAICDVDWNEVKWAFLNGDGSPRKGREDLKVAYDKAKRYQDWRVMLDEQKDIDAVLIAVPDHSHAAAASMAMGLGKHVYVQKPLTWSVKESRVLGELAKTTGVTTQMGNQGHSSDDARRVNEWIQAGVIGSVEDVHVWTNRPIWPQGMGRPEKKVKPHKDLNWDLWVGPSKMTDYHNSYCPFAWRGWLDYGVGALGDMGAHLVDHPYWALGLEYPTTIESTSTPFGQDADKNNVSWPMATLVHYEFKDRGLLPDVKMTWYDGGLMPARPEQLPRDFKFDRGGGVMYIGSKGILIHETYGENPKIYPESLREDADRVPQTITRIEGGRDAHEQNWIRAIKGEEESSSPFSYASKLNETMLLGCVALQAGQGLTIEWDGVEGKITNHDEANEFLHREYRDGYSLG